MDSMITHETRRICGQKDVTFQIRPSLRNLTKQGLSLDVNNSASRSSFDLMRKTKKISTCLSIVTDGREGLCADPGKRDATLGPGGPGPPGKGEGQQLVPDSGRGET
jgi:hypothetical protein